MRRVLGVESRRAHLGIVTALRLGGVIVRGGTSRRGVVVCIYRRKTSILNLNKTTKTKTTELLLSSYKHTSDKGVGGKLHTDTSHPRDSLPGV